MEKQRMVSRGRNIKKREILEKSFLSIYKIYQTKMDWARSIKQEATNRGGTVHWRDIPIHKIR